MHSKRLPPSSTYMTFWFPVFLVLFEFATYVSNDMSLPAMPTVVREFGAGPGQITLALTVSLLGNVALQWLLGPLSDHKGRRIVMLSGVALFVLSCAAMYWSESMSSFIALRFVQGMGVAFVAAVGYPAVHEAFDEVKAVKTIALMASVALFAPLIGPVLGALVLEVASWRTIFALTAVVGTVAWLGMAKHMPETASVTSERLSLCTIARTYRRLLGETALIRAAFAIGALSIPFMTWIALGPVIFMTNQHLGPLAYAWRQLPVIGAMSASCLIAGQLASRISLDRLAAGGLTVVGAGAGVMVAGRLLGEGFASAVPGFVVYAAGLGVSYTALYRLALFSSDAPKGGVAAMINSILLLTMVVGVEGLKRVYLCHGDWPLVVACAGIIAFACYVGAAFLIKRSDITPTQVVLDS